MTSVDLADCAQAEQPGRLAEDVRMVGDGTWLSTAEAAKIIGCSPSHVIKLVDTGQLAATKVGNRRRVLRPVAEAYRDRMLREARGEGGGRHSTE